MLSLTRKVGQTIHIGDSIVLTVTRVAGNRVAIRIDAPREIPILRGELVEAARLLKENSDDCI